MKKVNKPMYYWTFEKVKEEALKYKYKKDFKKFSSGAYDAALKNNWYYIVCQHMKLLGNKEKRCIYVWEFEDKTAYIGLTYNFEERKYNHTIDKRSSVYKQLTLCSGICYKLTEYVDKKEAQKLETFYIEKYKSDDWFVLNRAKAGALGGSEIKYTFEIIAEEALKYNHRIEFKNKNKNFYQAALNNKWLNDVCSHMTRLKPYNYKWDFENIKKEALKYNYRSEFKSKSQGAYDAAITNKWLDIVCSHMIQVRKTKNFWQNYNNCLDAALKCKTKKDFHSKYSRAYIVSLKNNWLNKICSHMK
jgi:predicted GIY-YIG superfamily endonuclease